MLELYFKTEDRARGEALSGAVSLGGISDSAVRAFVDGNKVTLVSDGIESVAFTASCACANGRKGRLCQHIWAVVRRLEGSDFLSMKTEVQGTSPVAKPHDTKRIEMRKQQAERQKARRKELRRERKFAETPSPLFAYPHDVEEARAFFLANGFPLEPLAMEPLVHAKKLLSRVFHPDKGGTHDEVVELNRHFDAIAGYLEA